MEVNFLVWMHYKECFNAGDDAKLLFGAAPDRTKLFVFGLRGDDERLRHEVDSGPIIMLFPSEEAITVEELKGQLVAPQQGEALEANFLEHDHLIITTPPADASAIVRDDNSGEGCHPPDPSMDVQKNRLRILVLDGTWTMVRKMRTYFLRHIAPSRSIPQVQLRPRSLEYWSMRGNRSVYSRTQATPDRICTIEALALLLLEMGENEGAVDELIGYVELNNLALHPERAQFAKGSTLREDAASGPCLECEHLYFRPCLISPWAGSSAASCGAPYEPANITSALPIDRDAISDAHPHPTGKNGKRRARKAQMLMEFRNGFGSFPGGGADVQATGADM